MGIIKEKFCTLSSDKIHTLSGVVFRPEGEACGFFQIVHGMTEHIARYERLMADMAAEGWIVFGHDHLGHGNTARDDGELGYVAARNGWRLLIDDVKEYSDAVIKNYSADDKRRLPYCLMGHSMGSFIARPASEQCVHPDALVVMGTGGSNPAADAGLALIALIKRIRGDKHISGLIDNLSFGSYNKRFGGGTPTDPKPWLTTDESARKRYYADKFCTFKFTVSAMGDLIRLVKYSNRKAWYENFPKDIPVLLLSGADDPVGNYGKGTREVGRKLLAQKIDTGCIIYDGARHEILNDFTYDAVKKDIINFFTRVS